MAVNKKTTEKYMNCSVLFALEILSKKWVMPIICSLNQHEVMRFGELSRSVSGITSAMLTNSLKELQSYGIVSRIQYNEMPLRVEYSLTKFGREMVPSIMSLSKWGLEIMGDEMQTCDCPHGDCLVKAHNIVHYYKNEMQNMRNEWDRDYQKGYDRIQRQQEEMDPLDKLVFLVETVLRRNTKRGEEFSRLATIYFILGESKSDELISQERIAVKILREILAEAREQNILTDVMTDDQIIHSVFAYIQGLNSYWELERGSYDIIEKNHLGIKLFMEGFRKK